MQTFNLGFEESTLDRLSKNGRLLDFFNLFFL